MSNKNDHDDDDDDDVISWFAGKKYGFLSNFHWCSVMFEGVIYPSSEHAYQAAKTTDLLERFMVFLQDSPKAAKRYGHKLTLREGWNDSTRISIMTQILQDKFDRNPELASRLLETGNATLIEGNNWGDTFWGVCRKQGTNHLGNILMKIREDLK